MEYLQVIVIVSILRVLDTVWKTKELANKCLKAKFKSLWEQYRTNWIVTNLTTYLTMYLSYYLYYY